jgi:hypothetical protein
MNEPINGPFEFGDEPPKQLMGWRPDLVEHATRTSKHLFASYRPSETVAPKVPPPIWKLTKLINNNNHLPTFAQKTGDCVPAALAQAGARLQVAEIATLYQEEILHLWNVPFIYGISRVQIGGGQIPGPGSTGAWGAAAVRKYGVLFDADPGVPDYSGQLSDRWGEPPGPPQKFQDLAHDNPVRSTAPLNTLEKIRNALCNYYPITIASSQGFRMRPIEHDGYHVFVPSGTWNHQMCLLAWMDKPFAAAYRLNSWGPNAHGTPLHDEPPGGAWCTVDVLARELAQAYTEAITYSSFDGWPSAADRGLLSAYADKLQAEMFRQEMRDHD